MNWLLRRIAISVALVWVVATIVFLAIHLVPGDPAELLLSQGGVAPDPAAVAELRTQLGLDRPMLAQYGDIDLTFVPYDGIPLALPDVMANRVNLAVGAVPTMLPLVRSAALKALAVISPPAISLR